MSVRAVLVSLAVCLGTGCAGRPFLGDWETAPPLTRSAPTSYRKSGQRIDLANPLLTEKSFTCRGNETTDCAKHLVDPTSRYFAQSYFSNQTLNRFFGAERGVSRDGDKVSHPPYRLGLALAGGGTKASDYGLGVLAALHDPGNRGLSQRVEIISSVSGGSYASLWYFSRLVDYYQIAEQNPGAPRRFAEVFDDCLPLRYAPLWDASRGPRVCSQLGSALEHEPGDERLHDHYRFQNHLRGFQDVFAKSFDYDQRQKVAEPYVYPAVLREAGLTALTLPAHWFARGLFDWKDLNLAISSLSYFDGIERTFALRPVTCETVASYKPDGSWSRACAELTGGDRPSPNRNAGRGYTMTVLSALYYHAPGNDSSAPKVPFWVLNTTAAVSRYAFTFGAGQSADLEDSVFEFTPYDYGSRHFGYWVGTPSGYELNQLAGASAAFLDGQQRSLGRAAWNALAAGFFNVLNMNWGVNLVNPRYRSEVRVLHAFLPFPLSAFHHRRKSNEGAWIHLSDGGQSDNTGVWSLVRRGVPDIVLSDHSYDAGGRFDDLCSLRTQLARHNLYLRIPELERFAEVCAGIPDGPHYDLWAWKPRVLHGCITSNGDDSVCGDASATYFARLFILKPAIDLETLEPYLVCGSQQTAGDERAQVASACAPKLAELRRDVPGYADFPSELFGFLAYKHRPYPPGKHPTFPQHSTVLMTLDSSAWLYGAYRELARWQAAHLQDELEQPVAPLSLVVPLRHKAGWWKQAVP
jgi:hypothetical protein